MTCWRCGGSGCGGAGSGEQRDGLRRLVARGRVGRPGARVGGQHHVDRVVAGAAVEPVVALDAADGVVAVPAVNGVVARAAKEFIATAAAIEPAFALASPPRLRDAPLFVGRAGYLAELRDRLAAQLDETGKRGWAEEEFAAIVAAPPPPTEAPPPPAVRVSRISGPASSLNPWARVSASSSVVLPLPLPPTRKTSSPP